MIKSTEGGNSTELFEALSKLMAEKNVVLGEEITTIEYLGISLP